QSSRLCRDQKLRHPRFPETDGCGEGPSQQNDPPNSYDTSAGLADGLGGFWERDLKDRSAVPRPTPSLLAIWFHERPRARRPATWSGSTSTRGRPNCLPCFLARLMPI